MSKNQALKIVNPILGLVFLTQALSGLFHGALGEELFEGVHITGAFLLIAGILTHLFLNWTWVANNLLRKKPAA